VAGGGCCGAAMQKTACARVFGPPRSASFFLFRYFPHRLRPRTPGLSSHSSGGRLASFSLPFALPRYRSSPLTLHPQFVADLAEATTDQSARPRHVQITYIKKKISFLFLFFLVVSLGSFCNRFAHRENNSNFPATRPQ